MWVINGPKSYIRKLCVILSTIMHVKRHVFWNSEVKLCSINIWQHDNAPIFHVSCWKPPSIFLYSVHRDSGGRQVGPRPEVGRQGDQVCQGDQGWQAGHGKRDGCSSHVPLIPVLFDFFTIRDFKRVNLLKKQKVWSRLCPKWLSRE